MNAPSIAAARPGGPSPSGRAGIAAAVNVTNHHNHNERTMPMIDANEVVTRILAAASAAPNRIAAERAVAPLLAQLRDEAKAMRVQADAPVMLRTWTPEGPSTGETTATTAGRLSARLDELKLAKRFGDATDVQRVLDLTLDELRTVAMGRVPTTQGTSAG